MYTAWYTLDSQVSAALLFIEPQIVWLIFGGSMIYFNLTSGDLSLYAGIFVVLAGYFNVSNIATIMSYAAINSVYLQTRYDETDYTTIKFGTFANAFGAEGDNAWL